MSGVLNFFKPSFKVTARQPAAATLPLQPSLPPLLFECTHSRPALVSYSERGFSASASPVEASTRASLFAFHEAIPISSLLPRYYPPLPMPPPLATQKLEEADAKAESENLRQLELSAAADVWERYYDFVTAIKKLEASKAYLDASKGAYDLSMEGYKSGLKSILDVLNSEADLSDSRSQVIKSRKELYVSFAQLIHATGSINERTDAAKAQTGSTIEL